MVGEMLRGSEISVCNAELRLSLAKGGMASLILHFAVERARRLVVSDLVT